jgi:SAM-dependent methyltransferase
MPEPDIARGFGDVDRSADPSAFVNYLHQARDDFVDVKQRARDALALRAGDATLDLGCGTGDELGPLAQIVGPQGRVVGVDVSDRLVAEAWARTGLIPSIHVAVGDAHALPFAEDEFSASRAERVLMHVEDPGRALAEMVRVTRAGGRVIAIEPDWDTLIIDSDDLGMARRVARAHADAIRHPDIGRRLPRLATDAGLETLGIEFTTIPIRDPERAEAVFRLRAAIDNLDDVAASSWWDAVKSTSTRRPFVAAVTAITLISRKPPRE